MLARLRRMYRLMCLEGIVLGMGRCRGIVHGLGRGIRRTITTAGDGVTAGGIRITMGTILFGDPDIGTGPILTTMVGRLRSVRDAIIPTMVAVRSVEPVVRTVLRRQVAVRMG